MKKIIYSLSAIFVVGSLMAIFGCAGGGGGGSPSVVTDAPGITSTLNGFMRAVVTKNKAAIGKFMSPRLQTSSGSNSTLTTLVIWDFGTDINNQNDDASYTFSVPEGGIVQPSADYAEATAVYSLADGTVFTIQFKVVRTSGIWYIDDLAFSAQSGGTVPISSYFPLSKGNYWEYSVRDAVTGQEVSTRNVEVASDPISVAGKTFYPQHTVRTPVGSTAVVIKNSNRYLSMADFADYTDYYSTGQDGLYYYHTRQNFNLGVPVKQLDGYVKPGSTGSGSFSIEEGGTTYYIDYTLEIASLQTFQTPVQAFSVVPVIWTETYRNNLAPAGASIFSKGISYYSLSVGEVGEDEFDPADSTKLQYRSVLTKAYVDGAEYGIPTQQLAILTKTLADATVNTSYSQAFSATGGKLPYTWTVSSGTLPTGLSLISITGLLSGTPTLAGTYIFEVKVTDAAGAAAATELTLVVNSSGSTLALVTNSLSDASWDSNYNLTLTATGGTPPYTFGLSGLPSGLTYDSSSGLISGYVTAANSAGVPVTITVTDSASETSTPTILNMAVINPAITGTLDVSASFFDLSTLEVFFLSGAVATDPDSISAQVLTNYILEDTRISKTPPTVATGTFNPISVSIFGNKAKLTFASEVARSPTLSLKVQNIRNSLGQLQTSNSPVSSIGNSIKFISKTSWLSLGYTAPQIPIKIRNPGGEVVGGNQVASLFFIQPVDGIRSTDLKEIITIVGGVATKNLQIGPLAPPLYQWFTTWVAGCTTYDLITTYDSLTNITTLWAYLDSGGTDYIVKQQKIVPPAAGVATSVPAGFLGTPGERHFDTFEFSVAGPATRTAMVVAEGTNLRSLSWYGSSALPSPSTLNVGLIMTAEDSLISGATPEIRMITTDGKLQGTTISNTGAFGALQAPYSLPNPGGNPNVYGMFWIANYSGNQNEFLITDKLGDSIYFLDTAAATPVKWAIGGDAQTSYVGRPLKPFSITVLTSQDYNSVTNPNSYWILVADADGLSVYRPQ